MIPYNGSLHSITVVYSQQSGSNPQRQTVTTNGDADFANGQIHGTFHNVEYLRRTRYKTVHSVSSVKGYQNGDELSELLQT